MAKKQQQVSNNVLLKGSISQRHRQAKDLGFGLRDWMHIERHGRVAPTGPFAKAKLRGGAFKGVRREN